MKHKKCENCKKTGTGSINGHEFCSRPACISKVIKDSLLKIKSVIESACCERIPELKEKI